MSNTGAPINRSPPRDTSAFGAGAGARPHQSARGSNKQAHANTPAGQQATAVPRPADVAAAAVSGSVYKPRKPVKKVLGNFGEYTLLDTADDLWFTYNALYELAEEVGVLDEVIMQPLIKARRDLANGKTIESMSAQDAKALAIEKFKQVGMQDPEGVYATMLSTFESLISSEGKSVIFRQTSVKGDGSAGNTATVEHMLPSLVTKEYKSNPAKNHFAYKGQRPKDDKSIADVFLTSYYKSPRHYSDALLGITVTDAFMRYMQGNPIRDLTKPEDRSKRSDRYFRYLQDSLARLQVGSVIPYALAFQLYQHTADRSAVEVIKDANGQPIPGKKPSPVFYFGKNQVILADIAEGLGKLLGFPEVTNKKGEIKHSKGALDKTVTPPADVFASWLFWKVIGHEKTKPDAVKVEAHQATVAGRFSK